MVPPPRSPPPRPPGRATPPRRARRARAPRLTRRKRRSHRPWPRSSPSPRAPRPSGARSRARPAVFDSFFGERVVMVGTLVRHAQSDDGTRGGARRDGASRAFSVRGMTFSSIGDPAPDASRGVGEGAGTDRATKTTRARAAAQQAPQVCRWGHLVWAGRAGKRARAADTRQHPRATPRGTPTMAAGPADSASSNLEPSRRVV